MTLSIPYSRLNDLSIPYSRLKNSYSICMYNVVDFVIFLKVCFALKVNIYLQNMSKKRRLGRFDPKQNVFFSLFFLCALLIMHVPISKIHAQWH